MGRVIQALGTEFAELEGAKKANVARMQRAMIGRGCPRRMSEKCWADHSPQGLVKDLGCHCMSSWKPVRGFCKAEGLWETWGHHPFNVAFMRDF